MSKQPSESQIKEALEQYELARKVMNAQASIPWRRPVLKFAYVVVAGDLLDEARFLLSDSIEASLDIDGAGL